MNLCPPELHSYIAFLASTMDEGLTIRSLSLVSRYFCQVACPLLYRSISVSGGDQILSLAERLEALPPHHVSNILHIFISDNKPLSRGYQSRKPSPGGHSPEQLNSEAINRILVLSAPSVRSLTLILSASPSHNIPIFARLFRITHPHLEEITLSGFYPYPSLSSRGKFPSLKRLHLHGNRNPHGLLQVGNLAEVCPNLTHLRISGLNMAVSFAWELEDALKSNSHDADHEIHSPFRSTLPRNIQHIIVQPGLELANFGATASIKEEVMMKRLENLVGEGGIDKISNEDGRRFSLLPRNSTTLASRDFHQWWIERLSDKPGCWMLK